jgi:hypothetical protein
MEAIPSISKWRMPSSEFRQYKHVKIFSIYCNGNSRKAKKKPCKLSNSKTPRPYEAFSVYLKTPSRHSSRLHTEFLSNA